MSKCKKHCQKVWIHPLGTSASSNGNTILYNSSFLQEVNSGIFNIPRDVSSVYEYLYLMITFLVSNLFRRALFTFRTMHNVPSHGQSFVSSQLATSFCSSIHIFLIDIIKPRIQILIRSLRRCYLIRGMSLVQDLR